jgi:molybdopterin biosynthesis enzyme
MVRLVPLLEARTAFLAKIAPVASASMATAKAGGLVLAEDILATSDVPLAPIALEHGYAVASRDTVGASSYMPTLVARSPVLVEPSDALPTGADAVADADDIRAIGSAAEILATIAPGQHVRGAGGDFAAGQVMARAGTRLGASVVAVLRGSGIKDVPVRTPGVVLIGPQGTCATAALVMDLAAQAGADVTIAYVPQSRIAGAIRSAASADVVLVAGWTGAGLRSAVSAFAEAADVVARDIALAPGRMASCGFLRTSDRPGPPIILLPGRPEETLAAWLMLARPCLDRLAGLSARRPAAALPLARKITSAPGIADLALVKREGDRWKPLGAGNISWAALADAHAWLEISADSEGYPAGEVVEAEFL